MKTITALRSFRHGIKPVETGDELVVSPVDAQYYVDYGFAREGSKDAVATDGRMTEEARRFGAAMYSRKDMVAGDPVRVTQSVQVSPAVTTEDLATATTRAAADAVAQQRARQPSGKETSKETNAPPKATQEVKPLSTQATPALVAEAAPAPAVESRVVSARANPGRAHINLAGPVAPAVAAQPQSTQPVENAVSAGSTVPPEAPAGRSAEAAATPPPGAGKPRDIPA